MSKMIKESDSKLSVDRFLVEITIPMHQRFVIAKSSNIYEVEKNFRMKKDAITIPGFREEFDRMSLLLKYAASCDADYVEIEQISRSLKVKIGFKSLDNIPRFIGNLQSRVEDKVRS
jgi:hypothetical protein